MKRTHSGHQLVEEAESCRCAAKGNQGSSPKLEGRSFPGCAWVPGRTKLRVLVGLCLHLATSPDALQDRGVGGPQATRPLVPKGGCRSAAVPSYRLQGATNCVVIIGCCLRVAVHCCRGPAGPRLIALLGHRLPTATHLVGFVPLRLPSCEFFVLQPLPLSLVPSHRPGCLTLVG